MFSDSYKSIIKFFQGNASSLFLLMLFLSIIASAVEYTIIKREKNNNCFVMMGHNPLSPIAKILQYYPDGNITLLAEDAKIRKQVIDLEKQIAADDASTSSTPEFDFLKMSNIDQKEMLQVLRADMSKKFICKQFNASASKSSVEDGSALAMRAHKTIENLLDNDNMRVYLVKNFDGNKHICHPNCKHYTLRKNDCPIDVITGDFIKIGALILSTGAQKNHEDFLGYDILQAAITPFANGEKLHYNHMLLNKKMIITEFTTAFLILIARLFAKSFCLS